MTGPGPPVPATVSGSRAGAPWDAATGSGPADEATPQVGPDLRAALARIAAEAAQQVTAVHAVDRVTVELAVPAPVRTATIRLGLVTVYGHRVVAVAEAVRRAVRQQVGARTGVAVGTVDVTVEDLVVGEPSAPEPADG